MAPKKDPAEQSILDKLSSGKPPPKTPIDGFFERLKNMFKNNFRGIIGVIVPLVVLLPQVQRFNSHVKLILMWQWMFWFYLLRPMAVPCTSLIPIFVLPMAGIYDSLSTCKCYMTEPAMLYITSSYLLVLLNNSGVDKRIALWLLCHGESDVSQFSGKKLVLKASIAAFILSMFSSRLIAAFNLIEIITNTLEKLEPSNTQKDEKSSAITEMRYVINNAIQTSASIGGLTIVHSSWVTLLFRACFQELSVLSGNTTLIRIVQDPSPIFALDYYQANFPCQKVGYENPDIFNYLQYSLFAIPVAVVMFIVNLIYHMILMSMAEKKGIVEAQTVEIRKSFLRRRDEIPSSFSLHEMYSVFFTVLLLVVLFTRYSSMGGWASKFNFGTAPNLIRCKDTTVTAIFVIVLHILPKSFGFLKLFSIKKRKDLPQMKPESAILWWRFVDKNVNYGYLFTIGSAVALLRAGNVTKLNQSLTSSFGMTITDLNWNVSLLVCILISAILCNVISAMASCAVWLPYILLLAPISVDPWPTKFYLPALGIGLACNFGFCSPFIYTPAYYCHYTGRVPQLKMVKYSILSVLICIIILYLGLMLIATPVFDPDQTGVKSVPGDAEYKKILAMLATPSPDAGGGPPPPPPPAPPPP